MLVNLILHFFPNYSAYGFVKHAGSSQTIYITVATSPWSIPGPHCVNDNLTAKEPHSFSFPWSVSVTPVIVTLHFSMTMS